MTGTTTTEGCAASRRIVWVAGLLWALWPNGSPVFAFSANLFLGV